jgi:hypothetical protein
VYGGGRRRRRDDDDEEEEEEEEEAGADDDDGCPRDGWRLAGALASALASMVPRLKTPGVFVSDATPLLRALCVAACDDAREREEEEEEEEEEINGGGGSSVGGDGDGEGDGDERRWAPASEALRGVAAFVAAASATLGKRLATATTADATTADAAAATRDLALFAAATRPDRDDASASSASPPPPFLAHFDALCRAAGLGAIPSRAPDDVLPTSPSPPTAVVVGCALAAARWFEHADAVTPLPQVRSVFHPPRTVQLL